MSKKKQKMHKEITHKEDYKGEKGGSMIYPSSLGTPARGGGKPHKVDKKLILSR
jgi:hypothetical protein